jgi:hypothetical protein
MAIFDDLRDDIQALYERGYISHAALSVLPATRMDVDPNPTITIEQLREVLRGAGYSDEQISARDYR